MGESGDQSATPGADSGKKKSVTNDNERKPHRSRRNHENRANKQKWKEGRNETPIHIPKEKFVGCCDDLKGFIYDVMTSKGGVAYTRTTKEIARYVGKKYTTTAMPSGQPSSLRRSLYRKDQQHLLLMLPLRSLTLQTPKYSGKRSGCSSKCAQRSPPP
jgi:hypothetical protein